MLRNSDWVCAITLAALAFSSALVVADDNASIETRRSVAESIRVDLARELTGKVFSGSVTRRIGEEFAGLKFTTDLTGTATGTFTDPARNLLVEITHLSQPTAKTIGIQATISCPFGGTTRVKSRVGSASTEYTARVAVSIDVEVSLSFDAQGNLTAVPKIRSATGRMSNVKLEQRIADRLISEPLEAAINQWMSDNPQPFLDATRVAIERGARQMNAEFRRQTDTLLAPLRTAGLTAAQEQQLRQAAAQLTPTQREQILGLILQSGVTLENLTAQQNAILKSLNADQKKQLTELLKSSSRSATLPEGVDASQVIQSIGALLKKNADSGDAARVSAGTPASHPQTSFTPEQKRTTDLILKQALKKR
ncbi:MAG: hypothetical protein O2820_16055 [Planctomycetota bacterium]|nr:hypothetical protein [Planctomycetota bacterium]MDA1250732.1 hypothetical protein [Planctomycetota bacterium]